MKRFITRTRKNQIARAHIKSGPILDLSFPELLHFPKLQKPEETAADPKEKEE